jgi:glyceraldehyde 3-phosphate dehydrogenase
MTIKIAINGLGRIGRCSFRAILENPDKFELVAINAPAKTDFLIHLLKYDSVHGRINHNISNINENIAVDGKEIKTSHERDLNKVNWSDVDIVLECTGKFKDSASCNLHLQNGAKKVIISAPTNDESIKTIIYGVNENIITKNDDILSIGSCTTNCLAPITKILHDQLTITKGFVTTIHAYTNDQNLTDGSHKDMRRARAAAVSMIPTSTGAAKAISKVIPDLAGKLDGTAIRVPTSNVSMIDFCFVTQNKTTAAEINQIIKKSITGNLKNVLSYCDEELVSIDFNHTIYSSIFDATATKTLNDDFIRIAAWYDNEWGFTQRMLDIAAIL